MLEPVEALGHSSGMSVAEAAPGGTVDGSIRKHARPLAEVFFFVFVPLYLGPLLIVQYLAGVYHAHPITVDGKYFPDGGFLFDLHTLWAAGPAGTPPMRFASMPRLVEETRCRPSPGAHGFPPGAIFCHAPDNTIYQIDADFKAKVEGAFNDMLSRAGTAPAPAEQ